MYYYRARYYVPGLRFISEDPLGLVAGWNEYSYVGNSPLRYVDPTGEFIQIGSGAVVGGIAGLIGALNNPCATGADIAWLLLEVALQDLAATRRVNFLPGELPTIASAKQ